MPSTLSRATEHLNAVDAAPTSVWQQNRDGYVIDCGHVFGLLTRHHDRRPRWDPRSSPKQTCGFESRDVKRVLWIVGSTDRHLIQLFHLSTNAR
jgi:hypothetical protein